MNITASVMVIVKLGVELQHIRLLPDVEVKIEVDDVIKVGVIVGPVMTREVNGDFVVILLVISGGGVVDLEQW